MLQTFGDRVNPHPHVHALASRGGWTRDEHFPPVPYVDPHVVQGLFRQKVFAFLLRKELITHERVELLTSWKHRPRRPLPRSAPPASAGPIRNRTSYS